MKYYDPTLFALLLIITIVWLFLIWKKRYWHLIANNAEGFANLNFQQDSPYVLKQDLDVYDTFYVEAYRPLMRPQDRADEFVKPVLRATMPSTLHSLFLDVGCGTGAVLDAIHRAGYSAIGIDRAPAMIEACPAHLEVKLGDVLEPMQFDSRIFSHILVVDQVLYEWTLAEKRQFLQNCSHWIVPGGYIVLHLVDPGKYNTVVPAIQEKEKEKEKIEKRKTKQTNETKKETNDSDFFDSSIEFDTFSYSSSYEFPDEFSSVIVHTETFVDRSSQHVRANERVLHLSPVGDILKLAEQVGFHLQAKWVMPFDPHQYVFLLGL